MNTVTTDISTVYLGLNLRSPIIPSASPLTANLDGLQQMEECGAGAVILASLFEDPYVRHDRHPHDYLEKIAVAKKSLTIPVIASLNASTLEGWGDYARMIESAGADALELNIYNLSLNPDVPPGEVEAGYINAVKAVTRATKLPVAVKMPPYFTSLAYMAKTFDQAGARGLVLFNRFYQPDIDLLTMGSSYSLRLSTAAENRFPLRWLSLLYQQIRIDLAGSTGIRTGEDVLKMVLNGASAVQVCSILLQRGIPWLRKIEDELRQAMEASSLSSVKQARGLLSHHVSDEPGAFERDEYRKALQGYSLIDVPSWRDEKPIHAVSASGVSSVAVV